MAFIAYWRDAKLPDRYLTWQVILFTYEFYNTKLSQFPVMKVQRNMLRFFKLYSLWEDFRQVNEAGYLGIG